MQRTIASSLGLGLIPGKLRGCDAGAGTLGAVLALPLAILVDNPALEIALVVVVVVVGLWAAGPFAHGDPGWVVIDETAGAWLAMVRLGGWPLIFAWLVARYADISKVPPGVGAAERLPGSLGVMADDLVAGLYGLAAGWILFAV